MSYPTITAALEANADVRAIVHDVDGFRMDGRIAGDYADGSFAFIDDADGVLYYVTRADVEEWEVVG